MSGVPVTLKFTLYRNPARHRTRLNAISMPVSRLRTRPMISARVIGVLARLRRDTQCSALGQHRRQRLLQGLDGHGRIEQLEP